MGPLQAEMQRCSPLHIHAATFGTVVHYTSHNHVGSLSPQIHTSDVIYEQCNLQSLDYTHIFKKMQSDHLHQWYWKKSTEYFQIP